MNKTTIITRKIQLFISDYDSKTKKYSDAEKNGEAYKKTWGFLREIDNNIFRIANLVNTNLLYNTNWLNDKFTKENSYSYPMAQSAVKDLGLKWQGYSNLINSVGVMAKNKLKNDAGDIKWGVKTAATYKKGMPIPINSQTFSTVGKYFKQNDNNYYFTIYSYHFKLIFGKDKSNNRFLIEKINSGEYKFSDSSIQVKSDGKVYLLLCLSIPVVEHELDTDVVLGVDLGLSTPAVCALSTSKHYKKSLGSYSDFIVKRREIQNIYWRLLKNNDAKGGKGRKKKFKNLDKFKDREFNFVKNYYHKISRDIINEAIKNNAGTIKMENLTNFTKPKPYFNDKQNNNTKFIVRNWGYYMLQTLIEQKAKQNNINIIYIDPANTSKTCNKCNNINKELILNDRTWVCENCGETIDRDWNAAKNIASWEIIKEKKVRKKLKERVKVEK